jgi:hypothetical protein
MENKIPAIEDMNKRNIGLWFALAASLLLSRMYLPAYNVISGDKEIYRYIGRVILKGGVPYRDVFDHKPPLIYFLNAAEILLGGDWAQWTIDAILALLATGCFYGVCRRHRLPFPWLLPLLFNLMLRDHLLCLGMGMTREYTAMLLLIFFSVTMTKSRFRFYILGLLGGLTFFTQQDQVLALLPFSLYAFLPREDNAPLGRRLGASAAGFATVTLPVLLYFAVNHSLDSFWQDAFLFNLGPYTHTLKESNWDHWRKIKATLDQGNYEMAAMVSMTIGVGALFFRHANKRLLVLSLLAVFLSISTEFMGGRDLRPMIYDMGFTHYFLPLSASLPILLFVVFAFTEEPVLRDAKVQALFGVLLCASLAYTDIQHGLNLRLRETRNFTASSPVVKHLLQRRPGDYQYFAFFNDDATYVYNQLGTIGPGRFVYQHMYILYDNWDADHRLLKEIEQSLLQHQTHYVLDYGFAKYFRDQSAFAEWHSFLLQYYVPVDIKDAPYAILWKWKGSAD